MSVPSLEDQRAFWNSWNKSWRFRDDLDFFMVRQKEAAVACAQRLGLKNARILEAGCGTGWLGNSLTDFGHVTGIDLSEQSIADGKQRHPNVELICGDFLSIDFGGTFDLVISADSLAHMYDQQVFVNRIADRVRPGGTFLLMTQNPLVWNRRSEFQPPTVGQIERWPSLRQIRRLLARDFRIEHLSSIVPGGDEGILWWVENRYVRGGVGRLIGRERWRKLLERVLLGREFVIVARRNG